jgi:hypothetical protein
MVGRVVPDCTESMTKRKKTPELKTTAISEADRAIVRAAVAGDVRTVMIVEHMLARIEELEQYVDGIGPPMPICMG